MWRASLCQTDIFIKLLHLSWLNLASPQIGNIQNSFLLTLFLLCHSLISNSFSIFIHLLQKKKNRQQGRNVLWKSWVSLLELTISSTECFYEQEERTYDKWNMAKSWRRWWMKTNSKYFYCLQQSSSLSEQINSCILKIIHLTFQHQIMCTSI